MEALLLIDLQYDFLHGGALAVPDAASIVPAIHDRMDRHEVVIATQDWHPPGHLSFASSHPGCAPGDWVDLGGVAQILWPDHCVQDTRGSELIEAVDPRRLLAVVRKGTNPAVDSYSAFYDNHRRVRTRLEELLEANGITSLVVCGLATDYCVRATVLDALALGYPVEVVRSACRGVEVNPGDVDLAWGEMAAAGATIVPR